MNSTLPKWFGLDDRLDPLAPSSPQTSATSRSDKTPVCWGSSGKLVICPARRLRSRPPFRAGSRRSMRRCRSRTVHPHERIMKFATSTFVLACLSLPLGGHTPENSQAPRAPRLFKDSRQALAIARGQGRSSVVLLVASEIGQAARVASPRNRAVAWCDIGKTRSGISACGFLSTRPPSSPRATESSRSPSMSTTPTRLGLARIDGPLLNSRKNTMARRRPRTR